MPANAAAFDPLAAVSARWPAKDPSRIQLYSLSTPNGVKVASMLEELELPYEPHIIRIDRDEQFDPAFVAISPNSKIPVIIDPAGHEGSGPPVAIMESVAILLHLAKRSGKFMPADAAGHSQAMQWLLFQVGTLGPMFGQLGHFFRYAGERCEHPYPTERYTKESRRILRVLEAQLKGREFMLGRDYSIVDMAIWPWIDCLTSFYKVHEHLGLADFEIVGRWMQRCEARPASKRALHVCKPGAM